MREPSIHISRSAIIKFIQDNSSITGQNLDEFMKFSRKHSLDHRSLLSNNKKTQDKAQKRVKGSIGDAQMIADIIYSTRISLKHIGVTKIKQSDPQWGQLKELIPIINEFCNQNKLTKRQGYIEYISMGIKLFQSGRKPNYGFFIKWLAEKVDWVTNEYNSIQLLKGDKTPDDTKLIHDIYCAKVIEMTGIHNNYSKDPTQYTNFIEAKLFADNLDVDYEVFIEAQFEALAFCNGIPKITDLYGEKAKERLIRYMSANNLFIENKGSMKSKVDWSQFKR